MMNLNETPVYLLFNPTIAPDQKELPLKLFESGELSPQGIVHLVRKHVVKGCGTHANGYEVVQGSSAMHGVSKEGYGDDSK